MSDVTEIMARAIHRVQYAGYPNTPPKNPTPSALAPVIISALHQAGYAIVPAHEFDAMMRSLEGDFDDLDFGRGCRDAVTAFRAAIQAHKETGID